MKKILIVGAGGQIGSELTTYLRGIYGNNNVIASDMRVNPVLAANGPFEELNALDVPAYAAVVAKYNVALPPIFENSNAQADGTIELDKLSFGATSANMGEVLSRAYLNSIKGTGAAKYVSKDNIIDASTCVLPDNTWFIKNSVHEDFNTAINKLIYAILGSKEQLTVWDNSDYPQFLEYDKANNELTPVTKGEAAGSTGNESNNFLEKLVAAFQKIILFFRSLFGIAG